MQEAFLHFIWQHQYFQKSGLITHEGMHVNVIHPGYYNTDSGPDFREGRVMIGEIEWRGHIEIHVNSSDWLLHRHHEDENYNNVVLHVVWHHDKDIERKDGTVLPVIELEGLIEEKLIFSYRKLINSPAKIPCEAQLHQVEDITWLSALDKAVMERLMLKAGFVLELLEENNKDWEETAYQLLARNFGFRINSEPFFQMAKSLPFRLLRRHSHVPVQIEALLFGQAGFLQGKSRDQYQAMLKKEYRFLQYKHDLPDKMLEYQWKLLRLRPANFPSVRIAQFASIMKQVESVCKSFLELRDVKALKKMLRMKLPEYWQKHYHFGKPAARAIPGLGESSIEIIAINTVAPLMAAYGRYIDDSGYIERAIDLLQSIKGEKNRITNYWQSLNKSVPTAFDSQAMIHLYNEYCAKHRCLACNIGSALIRKA